MENAHALQDSKVMVLKIVTVRSILHNILM